MKELNWISSSGGALIAMPKIMAKNWYATDDYDLTCNFNNYADVLKWKNIDILILGDEPLITTAIEINEVMVLVRCRWSVSDAIAEKLINQIDLSKLNEIEKNTLEWNENSIVIFDAADDFKSDYIEFNIEKGRIQASTYMYQPNSENCFLLHALRKN